MNKRFVSVVIFALVVAGAVSLAIYRMVATHFAANAQPASAHVIVATRTLPMGTLIKEPDLRVAEWRGPVPAQAVLKEDDIIGRGVVADINEGEPIVDNRLAPKGAGAGMASTIPKGMRAVAVRVNEVVGVAGFVVPGMRVDVLVSGNPPLPGQNRLGTETRTILQNIQVLSAGQNIQKDAEGKPVSVQVVNLLVDPKQAEVLSLASDMRIQLVLRNPLDTEVTKTPGVAVANLFTDRKLPVEQPEHRVVRHRPVVHVARIAKPAPPVVKPQPEVRVVEVIHGAKKQETKFVNNAEVQQ